MSERLSGELNDLLGDDGFLLLIENQGGKRLHIPVNPNNSQLSDQIGLDNVEKLSKRYAGDQMRVPLAREFRVRQYRALDISNAKIARRIGMTETGVDKIVARLKRSGSDPRQNDLFAET